MMSALLIQGVPIECVNQAAVRYYVPAKVILSVLKTERGKPGLASSNTNGTVDLGPMQINSIWLKKIIAYGVSAEKVRFDPCVNVAVGTWILGQYIASSGSYWTGVANYHSHTPIYNHTYQQKIRQQFNALTQVMDDPI